MAGHDFGKQKLSRAFFLVSKGVAASFISTALALVTTPVA